MADEPFFEAERRRLAGMLPGAAIEPGTPAAAADAPVELVALVDDLDRPIPVLVERGRWALHPDQASERLRVLERPGLRLVLTTDRDELARRAGGAG